MKRILFLDQYATLGGGQTVLLQLCPLFRDLGWKVTVAFPMGGEVERRMRQIQDIKIVHLDPLELSSGKKTLKDVWQLAKYSIKQLKLLSLIDQNDVVYVNGPRLFPIAWGISFLRPRNKFIYHVHLDHSRSEKELILRILRNPHTTKVIVNSEFTKSRLLEFHKDFGRSEKIQLLENALGPQYTDLTYRPPQHAGKSLRFVTVGRISSEKGQGFIVDLAKLHPDQLFFLVGAADFSDSKFSDYLRQNAPQNVIFAGKTTDVPKFIRDNQISAAIVPSQVNESFGLVAIEAMASSCATIVSDRGELPNIAKRTGAWVFKDHGELGKSIQRLMEFDEIELGYLVKGQFDAAKKLYSPARFESDVKKLAGDLVIPSASKLT